MIPDAPYIREAETLGMPPYDEPDFSQQIKELEEADKNLDVVVDILCDAEDKLIGSVYEDGLRDLIRAAEDLACDVRLQANKIRGIV